MGFWVFGYGSLMWDGWETRFACTRRELADLRGYARAFDKPSVLRWGTAGAPGVTLRLARIAESACRGMAFEFADASAAAVRDYLREREGPEFALRELPVRLADGRGVAALVAMYEGGNVLAGETLDRLAGLACSARGTAGACREYVQGIASKLEALAIDDPAVARFWAAVCGMDAREET